MWLCCIIGPNQKYLWHDNGMECFVYQKTMELLCAQSIAWGMHWDVFVGLPQRRSQCIQECWSAPVCNRCGLDPAESGSVPPNISVCVVRCIITSWLSFTIHVLTSIIQDSHCNLILIGSIVSCEQTSRCTICLRDSALYHHHWVTFVYLR